MTRAGGADVPATLGSWTDEAMNDADATPTYTTHAWRTGSEDEKTTTAAESEVLQQDTLVEIIN
jgi:hypothetical protein